MDYILMNKNTPVLGVEIVSDAIVGIKDILHPEYLPVGVGASVRELNDWWKGRAIPASRDGLKDNLSVLGVNYPDELVLKSFGLSLSDQYWVNSKRHELAWSEINFFENSFSEDVGEALFGGSRSKKKSLSLYSPDNTSDGWLKKKWIIRENKRYLVKAGSGFLRQEPYNEVIATEIFNKLGICAVQYTLEEAKIKKETEFCSICENFITPDTELVTAGQLLASEKKASSVSVYQHLINIAEKLEIPDAQKNIDGMLVVDYVIANSDRHFGNFGFIRDINTLKYLCVAPVYDSGTSLWHDTSKIVPWRPPESKPFYNNHKRQIKLVRNFDRLDLEKLEDIPETAVNLLKKNENISEERRCALHDALQYRIRKLRMYVEKLQDV